MIPTDHLEIIAGAAVAAAVVVVTITTFAATLTYLMFRERAHAPAAARVVPQPAAEPQSARVPATIAG